MKIYSSTVMSLINYKAMTLESSLKNVWKALGSQLWLKKLAAMNSECVRFPVVLPIEGPKVVKAFDVMMLVSY